MPRRNIDSKAKTQAISKPKIHKPKPSSELLAEAANLGVDITPYTSRRAALKAIDKNLSNILKGLDSRMKPLTSDSENGNVHGPSLTEVCMWMDAEYASVQASLHPRVNEDQRQLMKALSESTNIVDIFWEKEEKLMEARGLLGDLLVVYSDELAGIARRYHEDLQDWIIVKKEVSTKMGSPALNRLPLRWADWALPISDSGQNLQLIEDTKQRTCS